MIQPKEELKARFLPMTGIKNDLVERFRQEYITKLENGSLEYYKKEKMWRE